MYVVCLSQCVWGEDLLVIGMCMLCVYVNHSHWPIADQNTFTVHKVVLNSFSKKLHCEGVDEVPHHSVTFPV